MLGYDTCMAETSTVLMSIKMRASIVSRYGLSDIAREIELGQHILLGKGEQSTGGRDKP